MAKIEKVQIVYYCNSIFTNLFHYCKKQLDVSPIDLETFLACLTRASSPAFQLNAVFPKGISISTEPGDQNKSHNAWLGLFEGRIFIDLLVGLPEATINC